MRSEIDKKNGAQTHLTDKTRYTVKYYQLEKSYQAVVV